MTRLIRLLLLKIGLLNFARKAYGWRRGVRVRTGQDTIAIQKGGRLIRISRGHESFTLDLIKQFDYFHGAVEAAEINGLKVVDYTHRALQRLRKSGVELEFPSLAEGEDSIEDYLKALDLTEGQLMFDLGAYAGGTTYFFSKAVGDTGLVFALEPDRETFACLEANVRRHSLQNVKCLACGVWSEKTTLEFQSEGTMGSSATALLGRRSHAVQVPVVTLDDLAAMAPEKRVAAIKMDIEGAELPILKSPGAAAFFLKHKPRIVVEPHLVDGRFDTEEVCQLLRSFGYQTRFLSQGMGDAWPLIAGVFQT